MSIFGIGITNYYLYKEAPVNKFIGGNEKEGVDMGVLNAEKVILMLNEQGMEVTLEEAEQMLIFLRMLSKMVVANYIEEKRNESVKLIPYRTYERE